MADDIPSISKAVIPHTRQIQDHNSLKRNARSYIVIHVTIRPRASTCSTNNKYPNHNNSLRSISTHNERRNELNQSSIMGCTVKASSKSISSSVHVTRIARHQRPSSQATRNIQKCDDWHRSSEKSDTYSSRSETIRAYSRRAISEDKTHVSKSSKITLGEGVNRSNVKMKDTWANPMDYINKQNNNVKKKKKKKCTRSCVIISVLIGLILCIVIVVLLTTLLSKPQVTRKIDLNPVLRWNSTGITVAGISGVAGNNISQLNFPSGVVSDYKNTLYIADRSNNRVQKFEMNSSVGTTAAGYANGTSGLTLDALQAPETIILDSNNNLYIADAGNERIQFWPYAASSGFTVAGVTGSSGNATNQFNAPFGIAFDTTSNTLYIADSGNDRVMSYISGSLIGTVVAGGNGQGTSNIQFFQPTAIYFDSLSNGLVIVNFKSHNIVRWILGANSWTLVASSINGSLGSTSELLRYPMGLTFDPMGNLYVADRFNHRIQLFLNGQSNATTIAGVTGTSGSNSTLLQQPYALSLDNQLNLYVADTLNHRIQKILRY